MRISVQRTERKVVYINRLHFGQFVEIPNSPHVYMYLGPIGNEDKHDFVVFRKNDVPEVLRTTLFGHDVCMPLDLTTLECKEHNSQSPRG